MFLNTPCMPKGCYHCGNAISQLISDILVTYHRLMKPQQSWVFVHHAWNIHGRPFERLFAQQAGVPGTSTEIQALAEQHIAAALQEKAYVAEYATPNAWNVAYLDADPACKEFCVDSFYRLAERGYIEEHNGICYLNLGRFFEQERDAWLACLQSMHVHPPYHAPGILQQALTGWYPLTKQDRAFTPEVAYQGTTYACNPILQSLLLPAYIATCCHRRLPATLQVSASGHGMLKWHFLRSIVCFLLVREIYTSHLLLHGTLLGTDGTPMSKHRANVLQPSDLYHYRQDRAFVRYVLISSCSYKDLPLQIDRAEREFTRIASKVALIREGHFLVRNEQEIQPFVTKAFAWLERFEVKQALEQFYLAVKRAMIEPASLPSTHTNLLQLNTILLDARR